jgi:hypothetical protein
VEFQMHFDYGSSVLARVERFRIQGRAIHSILVDRDWTHTLRRSGFCGSLADARPSLTKLLTVEPLLPRLPDVSEMAEVLQVSTERANLIRGLASSIPVRPISLAATSSASHAVPAPGARVPGAS